jgi:predicted transglutaminase-like cysteine proteinase
MRSLIIVFGVLLYGNGVFAERSLFPNFHEEIQTPAAAEAMCELFPLECTPSDDQQPVPFSQERWDELLRVSSEVNDVMIYRTDWDKHGVDEKWTLDEEEGDCEEFVALKRHRLVSLGWPPSMLLVTIVQKKNRLMHAVLAARTSQGDIILDNKLSDGTTKLWFWYDLPSYTFVAQQSTKNPRQWVSLLPRSVTEADWRLQKWTASK